MNHFFSKLIIGFCLAISIVPPVSAGIVIDYTHDTGFFTANLTAKNALEAAVSDINAIIVSNFSAISPAQDSITGTFGSTTATFNHQFSYTNPSSGTAEIYNGGNTAIGVNEIRIFVGMRNLLGSTLGQGGPGGVGFSLSGGGFSSQWTQAMANAESASNAVYLRGGQGPVIAQINGSASLGPTTANYQIQYGNTIGNLWFDSDTNNDGNTDTSGQMDNFWHFDHTTSVAPTKFDFYSVAVHEVLHAIGFGSSETWDQQVSGTNWTGSNVIALLGSGVGVIDGGGAHVASAFNSIMTPTIGNGVRKQITALDIAFLQDLGFSVTAVPEPSSMLLVGLGALSLIRHRRRTKK